MSLPLEIAKTGEQIIQKTLAQCRALHKIPELGFLEESTSVYLRQQLTAMGIPFKYPVAVTGIVATIGTQKAPRFALRTDIDALPITVRVESFQQLKNTAKYYLHLLQLISYVRFFNMQPKDT